MAEAHAAVAFSFTVTPDGINLDVNHEAFKAVWFSGLHSWQKRIYRFKNHLINTLYPAPPASWLFVFALVLSFILADKDPSFGLMAKFEEHLPGVRDMTPPYDVYMSRAIFSFMAWLIIVLAWRFILKALLSYQGWMYEPRGSMSIATKLWLGLLKVFGGNKPLLFGYQGVLPKLPVPALQDTKERYLNSIRPWMEKTKYDKMEKLADEFFDGVAVKLQRYLVLKSWWASNYVSDWWEQYVYLSGRSPIMVNSNYYGLDAVFVRPTHIQVARAANVTHAFIKYRREIDRETLKPLMAGGNVPLCSYQYERQFNTTRVPGIETDTLVHQTDSKHIAVYCRGRYYKVYVHYRGRILEPCELEVMYQKIIDDTSLPSKGEEKLAALTAGDRIPWYKARKEYFGKGVNKSSLDAIEKAAFVVVLDEEPQEYDPEDSSKLDSFAHAMLHGKCYDRWFDKSFNLVFTANGRVGFNAEHSWADAPIMAALWEMQFTEDVFVIGADAPIMAYLWEHMTTDELKTDDMGYNEDGHCKGTPMNPPNPIRLQWDIPDPCIEVIENSLAVAQDLASDVDIHLVVHNNYGKGVMKKCKTSPDAFIQLALQLAYHRMSEKFCLTYEASMTRLYREGRTETVRSCTMEAVDWCKAMEDESTTQEERKILFRKATEKHVDMYRDAMTGKGIDRHLFCLYVVSKYLGLDNSFLKEVLSEPWRLSTSQTPHSQINKIDLQKHPDHVCAGGGFGPVSDDGYGVSYIIAGEDTIFFHISCKNSCPDTNSKKFGELLNGALDDVRDLFLK